MAAADGVGADFLHGGQSADPHFFGHGGADTAGVLMQADAFEFHGNTIQ